MGFIRDPERKTPQLTARQIEVAQLTAQGYSVGEIAQMLSLAESTVSSHIWNAAGELGTRGAVELAMVAGYWGVLNLCEVAGYVERKASERRERDGWRA